MSASSIGNILSYLEGTEENTEKVASEQPATPESGYDEATAAVKIASRVEQEQFEKMAGDAWFMGEVMAEAFHQKLEKLAVESGDQRIPGEIMHSTQGDPPMAHQRAEDLKDRVNVAAPILEAAVNQAVTNKVPAPVGPPTEVAPGAAPIMQPPSPPDIQGTDAMAPKTAQSGSGAELLLGWLRNQ